MIKLTEEKRRRIPVPYDEHEYERYYPYDKPLKKFEIMKIRDNLDIIKDQQEEIIELHNKIIDNEKDLSEIRKDANSNIKQIDINPEIKSINIKFFRRRTKKISLRHFLSSFLTIFIY